MGELDIIRQHIGETDKELARLFEKRMRLAEQVLNYKVKSGLSILDAEQESKVIEKNIDNISDPVLKEYYILFLKKVMEISRSYQDRKMNRMKVSYAGISGAFAHLASQKLFPNAEHIPYANFEKAYKACEDGEVDVAILPIENNYSGDVGGVMDLTFSGSLFVNMMLDFSVRQNLLALPSATMDSITEVISNPHALSQCSDYISEHNFMVIECENTAIAAKQVAMSGNKSLAAIASEETAKEYGLNIIESNINSSNVNTTRFAVYSRIMNVPANQRKMNEHFILVFTVRNQAGALAKALNIIGSHGFNMSNLHSRPIKDLVWNYYFFVELEGHIDKVEADELFRQLNTVCDKLKLVGHYKKVKI